MQKLSAKDLELVRIQSEKFGIDESKIIESMVKERKERFAKLKIGRNEKCPCGSGLKYKKCCIK